MTFEQLKEYHLCKIQVTLNSGEVYEGLITSHIFVNSSPGDISEISLMLEWSIIKINCKHISEVKKI